jgi:hypothetical protein
MYASKGAVAVCDGQTSVSNQSALYDLSLELGVSPITRGQDLDAEVTVE